MKKTPANYLRFIEMFPTLSHDKQVRLLSLIAPPSKVCRGLRGMRGQMLLEVSKQMKEKRNGIL